MINPMWRLDKNSEAFVKHTAASSSEIGNTKMNMLKYIFVFVWRVSPYE
jgi:hypothetical protein